MILGQSIMNLDHSLIKSEKYSQFLIWLNSQIRLDVDNLDNVLIASFLLIAGAAIFALATKPVLFPEMENASDFSETKTAFLPISQLGIVPLCSSVVGIIIYFVLIARMFALKNSIIDPILWLLATILIGYTAWVWDRKNDKNGFEGIGRIDAVIMIALVAGGLLIASYQLANIPNMLMGDEGNFFDTANAIAKGEYRPSFFDMGVYSYPVASSFWQAFILKLFGASLWSWRFSSVLIGVLAVVPLYLLGADLFGKRIGLLSSVSMLVAPYFLSFTRLGYNNSQVLLPVTLSAWLLYRGIKRKSIFLLFLGGVASGLGFLTYTAARISIVLAVFVFMFIFVKSVFKHSIHREIKSQIILILAFFLGWLIVASPHLVYSSIQNPASFRYKTIEGSFINVDAASPFFPEKEIFSIDSGQKIDKYTMYFSPKIYFWLFQRGFLRTILAFHRQGLITDHFLTSPIPGPVATIFYLMGLAVLLSSMREKRSIFLLTWLFLVFLFLSALNTFPPRQTHMIPMLPVMSLLIGLGLNALIDAVLIINNLSKNPLFRSILTLTGMSAIILGSLWQYFVVIPTTYRPDLDQVMNWAELSNERNIPFIYITNKANWQNWKPFLLGRLTSEKPFQVVSEEEYLKNNVSLPHAQEAVIFFHNNNYFELVKRIQNEYPASLDPKPILNRSDMRIGGMIIIGTFSLPAQIDLVHGIILLLISPSGIISLVLLFLAIILIFRPPDSTPIKTRPIYIPKK